MDSNVHCTFNLTKVTTRVVQFYYSGLEPMAARLATIIQQGDNERPPCNA